MISVSHWGMIEIGHSGAAIAYLQSVAIAEWWKQMSDRIMYGVESHKGTSPF